MIAKSNIFWRNVSEIKRRSLVNTGDISPEIAYYYYFNDNTAVFINNFQRRACSKRGVQPKCGVQEVSCRVQSPKMWSPLLMHSVRIVVSGASNLWFYA